MEDRIAVRVPAHVQLVSVGSLITLIGVLFSLIAYMRAETEHAAAEERRLAQVETLVIEMDKRVTSNEEYFKEALEIGRQERRDLRTLVERFHMRE